MRDSTARAVAGGVAGLTTTVLLYPLDLIKVRFQAFEGRTGPGAASRTYRTTLGAFATAVRSDGARSLYQGLGPSVAANTVSWALYFALYEAAKRRWGAPLAGWGGEGLRDGAAGALAGACAVALTNPVWVLKTRMQLDTVQDRQYTSMAQALRRVLATEGARGLYAGVAPALLLTSNGAVHMAVYEGLKRWNLRARGSAGRVHEYFMMGGAAKVVATTVTYPLQVVRTRMQQSPERLTSAYRRTLSTVRAVLAREGVRGLYKGLGPNLLRVAPASATTFAVYEGVLAALTSASPDSTRV